MLSKLLQPAPATAGIALDLFAGAGGLSLGFEAAGFSTVGIEQNAAACASYRENLKGDCTCICINEQTQFPRADVVIGGPPCQPFSRRGSQKGKDDNRDGFPHFVRAVHEVQPAIFVIENVRNLYDKHKLYLEGILDELRGFGYAISLDVLNAVDYGVAQNRERIIIVGHRHPFRFPAPLGRRYTVEDAIGDIMDVLPAEPKFLTEAQDAYIAKYEKASSFITPRDLHRDRPARTITYRNLAGATSDMQRIRLADGRRRRITTREAARLQPFPDWFSFQGKESEQFKQIGNAVPPLLALQLAQAVLEALWIQAYSEAEIAERNELRGSEAKQQRSLRAVSE
ncbi:MAG: DNA (cytosine-5-)-methyltransferase [Bacteroidetes bacterium]|nr:MAG: DNA (cytosine-5-)-methyltransferase [Bacteroidota bacterium]